MDAIAFARAQRQFAQVVEQAQTGPVHVTRSDGRDVVIISADHYASLMETLRIYASPKNRAELDAAIAAVRRGDVVEFDPTA